jgi:hypothetical protein
MTRIAFAFLLVCCISLVAAGSSGYQELTQYSDSDCTEIVGYTVFQPEVSTLIFNRREFRLRREIKSLCRVTARQYQLALLRGVLHTTKLLATYPTPCRV